jgi:hypothetical protein
MTSRANFKLDISSSYPTSTFDKGRLNCACGPIIFSVEIPKMRPLTRSIGVLCTFSQILFSIHQALDYPTQFRVVDSMPSPGDVIEVSVQDNILTYPIPNLPKPFTIKLEDSGPDMKFFLQLDRHFVCFYFPT